MAVRGVAPNHEGAPAIGRMLRGLAPSRVLALGWLFVVVSAYPGRMSAVSFDYLRQARSKFFTDAIPPGTSALWRLVELAVAGPAGVLFVQAFLFATGMYLVLRRVVTPKPAAWATCGVLAFPPVLVAAGTIWSQSLMAGFLLVAVGALGASRRGARLGAYAAMAAATAVQPSALVATLPLLVLSRPYDADARGVRRYARALVAWLVVSAIGLGTAALFAKQPSSVWHSTLARLDIAGSVAQLGDDAAAGATRTDEASAISAADRDALARAAFALAREHPGAYLRHRVSVLGQVLWLDERHPETAVPAVTPALRELALDNGVAAHSSLVQDTLSACVIAVAQHTPLFVPWIYAVIAVILVALARRQHDVLALLASGIAWEASLFVTATGPDYRNSFWLVATTCLSAVVLAVRRART